MMKKLVSVTLVITMILSLWISAYGEEGTGTETTVYQNIGEGTTTINPAKYDSGNFNGTTNDDSIENVYAGKWVSYNVNFLNSGIYELHIKYRAISSDSWGTININNKDTVCNYTHHNETVTEKFIINADSGECTFKYTNGSKSLYKIYSFAFKYLGNKLEYTKNGSECVETDIKPEENMEAESSATYTFDTELDGTYGVYATVEAQDGEYEFEGDVDGDFDIGAQFYGSATDICLGTAVLSKGTHEVTITNSGESSVNLKEIKLVYKYVSESETEEFMRSLADAKTRADLDTLFAGNNDKFAIPYADYLSNVFSKEIIYSKLLRFDFATMDQFNAKLMELYKEEIRNPFVEVKQDGKAVTQLAPGAFTVTVNPRLPDRAEVIAALYNDDYTELKATDKGTLTMDEALVLKGLTAETGYTKLKVFFLEDTDKVKPSELLFKETEIFVSPDGDDANDGFAPDSPITLEGALSKAKVLNQKYPRNIVICLLGGEYVLDNTIEIDDTFSPSDKYSISFVSLDDSNPAIISGGYNIENWTDSNNDGIYEAQLPNTITDVRQLYIDEYPAQRARSDKYYFADNRWNNTENDKDGEGNATGLTEDGFDLYNKTFPELTKPEYAELAYHILWTVQRLPVEDIAYEDDGRIIVKMDQPYYSTAITMNNDNVPPTIGNKFYVENDLSLLDEEGEFYFDKDTRKIYYMPFEEEDMSEVRAVIGRTEKLLTIKGGSLENKVKNITFDGIAFRYGGYYTKINEEGAVSQQAEYLSDYTKGLGKSPASGGNGRLLEAQIDIENAEGVIFENCDISCMGSTAIRYGLGVSNSDVKGCIFTDIGGSAISVGSGDAYNLLRYPDEQKISEDITLRDNIIGRIGLDFMFCPAISIYYAKNVDAVYNTIAHTPYSGVSVNWGWDHDYKLATQKDEKGNEIKYKTEEPSSANQLGVGGHNISYNRIYDISNSVVDGGHIYNVGYMTECNVTNNYLTDSPDHGGVYLDTGASNVKIRNNVFERCQKYNIAYGTSPLVIGNVADDNWADKAQESSWTSVDCSFEDIAATENGNWSPDAQEVIANAGVSAAYRNNLSRLDKPEWRTIEHFDHPSEQGLEPGVIYINGVENIHASYVNTEKKRTLPSSTTFSGIKIVSNFLKFDWLQYRVDIPVDGDYNLAIYYAAKGTEMVSIFLNENEISEKYDKWNAITGTKPQAVIDTYELPETNTGDKAHVPHTFKDTSTDQNMVLKLTKGTYYLRILNLGDSMTFSRFKLIPVTNN